MSEQPQQAKKDKYKGDKGDKPVRQRFNRPPISTVFALKGAAVHIKVIISPATLRDDAQFCQVTAPVAAKVEDLGTLVSKYVNDATATTGEYPKGIPPGEPRLFMPQEHPSSKGVHYWNRVVHDRARSSEDTVGPRLDVPTE